MDASPCFCPAHLPKLELIEIRRHPVELALSAFWDLYSVLNPEFVSEFFDEGCPLLGVDEFHVQ